MLKKSFKITDIQLFDYADDTMNPVQYSYSANVIINNSFVVQVSGDDSECTFDGITDPIDAFWGSAEEQKKALKMFSDDEIETALEKDGFENNIGWLEDNATEIMNPEYAKYRLSESRQR